MNPGADRESKNIRVLGVDASLRSTGVAVVDASGNRFNAIAYGNIESPRSFRLSQCLDRLRVGLTDVIERDKPSEAAIEGAFFSKNIKTAMILGHARGVAIAVCEQFNLPVYEYSPRRIKQAVVGYGSASKQQVRGMVVSILRLESEPQEDAGDALGIAICHLNSRTRAVALSPKRI